MTEKFLNIKMDDFPKNYDFSLSEETIINKWENSGIFKWNSKISDKEIFSVDTPPPTASGYLHMGHIFSYTHQDFIVRFQRMIGKNIFYPMGWDDNGLPTERRVQDYFNVRCDPSQTSIKNIIDVVKSRDKKSNPLKVSRNNFIELCHLVTQEDEKVFKDVFTKIALSVDWTQEYSTIGKLPRKLAQKSFLDLFNKGHIYNTDFPVMWDPGFQTAVAQAEVEDREVEGAFHDIEFSIPDIDINFTISTTRPELLPACVGITAHPDDKRYKDFFGKKAVTPLFGVSVPIFASDLVDPEKGTGILMVCTFGDQVDVQWWKENNLQLRQLLDYYGRFKEVEFGKKGWESSSPEKANSIYKLLIGRTVKQGRGIIVDNLKDPKNFEDSKIALIGDIKKITHSVRFYERSKVPLEYLSTRQWFVSLMDKKSDLIQKGKQISWHPEFMRKRYEDWTENLQSDWCISRQRFFGVPFPVWYSLDSFSKPDFENPIIASIENLPVDPTEDTPDGYDSTQRGKPNGFIGESDVFDTWFTSSLSPQIAAKWDESEDNMNKVFPNNIRPQSHEIIRTWAFYTIVKSLLHHDSIPWKNVVISGWILDPDRKKMSKSKGNVITPSDLINEYGTDPVRYWAASARLGTDTAFDEQIFKIGKRLSTKIYNASKFVLSQDALVGDIKNPLDLSFLANLIEQVDICSKSFNKFNFAESMMVTEKFFWNMFTDNYLELVKNRARQNEYLEQQTSSVATLRLTLNVLLRLFAPVLPIITDEIWSWVFDKETGIDSIHSAPWPSKEEILKYSSEEGNKELFLTTCDAIRSIRKSKSQNGYRLGAEVKSILLVGSEKDIKFLELAKNDISTAARCEVLNLKLGKNLEASIID
ncbi:MAG: valine--tRNA ligase [Chloroflexi bacterium]|nr:valine--tRNA ligase [Chloroflexota bacterium]